VRGVTKNYMKTLNISDETYEAIASQLKEDEKAKSNGVSRSSRTSQKDSTKNYSSRRGYSPRGI